MTQRCLSQHHYIGTIIYCSALHPTDWSQPTHEEEWMTSMLWIPQSHYYLHLVTISTWTFHGTFSFPSMSHMEKYCNLSQPNEPTLAAPRFSIFHESRHTLLLALKWNHCLNQSSARVHELLPRPSSMICLNLVTQSCNHLLLGVISVVNY